MILHCSKQSTTTCIAATVVFHFFYIATYESLCGIKLDISKETTSKWQNHNFLSNMPYKHNIKCYKMFK